MQAFFERSFNGVSMHHAAFASEEESFYFRNSSFSVLYFPIISFENAVLRFIGQYIFIDNLN